MLFRSRTITLEGTKYPWDSPTPFPGINLYALLLHGRFKGNRKEINAYCRTFKKPLQPPAQPKGTTPQQINAWLKATDNAPSASQSNQGTSSNKTRNTTNTNVATTSSANHHFSFDADKTKSDPSLAAFDIRLSSGASPNTADRKSVV